MFIVYKFVIRDPKAIFSSGINTIYEKSANSLVKLSKNSLLSNKFEINGVLTYNTTNEKYNDINNYSFDINVKVDKENHNMKIGTEIKNTTNNNLISILNYYYLNNKYYLDLGNNYNKSILLKKDILNIDNKLNLNNIDFNKLNNSMKNIKNIINSNIDRDKLVTNKINIDNNEFEYVDLKLTNVEYSNLISKIIDDIKNNNTLVDNLASAFKTNNEEVNNYLNDILKNNLITNFDNITFRFYTSGFMANIVGFEIDLDNNKLFYYLNDKLIINYDIYSLEATKDNNKYNAIIKKNNLNYLSLKFNELNDNIIDVDYKNYEDNSYGNFHLNNYDKDNDKSGNLKFSQVNTKETYSFNFDYRVENLNNISLTKESIDIDNIPEADYLETIKNVKYSFNNTSLKDYILDIVESIYNY